MNKRLAAKVACAALATTALLPVELAHAQQEQGQFAQQGQLEEVIVTARRRAEDIQKVPTAVTAFGTQQLAERNIVSEADLQSAVPGLTLRETQGSNSLTYAIRGQTVDNFTGSATAVVPYFDEVQLSTGGASTFFDLQSIQVLKGPQGTLFGRNATGGAVLFTSIKPQDSFGGYIKGRAGNYGMREGLGAINIPIVKDKLLLRVAGDAIHRDGYQHNVYNGVDLGVVERQSVRVSVLARPTEKLENTLVVEYDHSGGNSTADRLYAVNRYDPSTGTCATNAGFALNCVADQLFNPATFGSYWAAYLAAHPKVYPGGIGTYLQNGATSLGFWDANDASPVLHREIDKMLVNTTTYDVNPDLQLKNIFGASHMTLRNEGSSVGAPYLVFTSENLATGEFGNRTHQTTISDEAQVQGKAFNEALTYIFGAYYQNMESRTAYPQVYFDITPVFGPSYATNHFGITDKNEAVYAQGTYDFTSLGLKGVSFTGGYRFTWEQFEMTQLPGGIFPLGTQKVTFSNPSWTLGLSWQATDELMLYVQGRRSWRSGGFNGTAPPISVGASGGGNLFLPEYTRDVEIGAKYAGDILGRPGHVDFAAYNQWVDNVQRAQFPVPPGRQQSIAVTINVPEAEVTGIELDAGINATNWLSVGLSGALTDARFVSGQNTANIFGQLYIFNPFADSPRASGSIYATVTLPVPDQWGGMKLRADLYGQSGMYFSNNNSTITPHTRIPGYGLVNLRYDWAGIMGSNLSFAAYVTNLLDKEYYTGGFALATSLGVDSAAIGTPRMVGVELSYDF